jgi:sulfopyruvate decarboxylase subunit beta
MNSAEKPMELSATLRVLRDVRRDDEIVITSMSSAREWMALSAADGDGRGEHPLDLVLVPSSMGQATSFGLGLAMARRDMRVVVCSGDGSLLMNLGTLVTITAEGAANLVVLLFDNGVYEVTGAQPTPGAANGRVTALPVDFAAIARGCGFTSVHRMRTVAEWRSVAREVMDGSGPVLVILDVLPVEGGKAPRAPRTGTAAERGRRFAASVAEVTPRSLFSTRRASASDAADIEALIGHYVESGALLPRSESFIVENAADFIVAVEGERIVGCGHLVDYAPSLAELRSLAVHPERQGMGIGRAIAGAVEDLARRRQYRTLFAVSNDESFFLRQGYERREIPELDKERSAVSRFKGVYARTLG